MPWAWLRHLGSTRKALEPPTLPRGQRQTPASNRPRPATDPRLRTAVLSQNQPLTEEAVGLSYLASLWPLCSSVRTAPFSWG